MRFLWKIEWINYSNYSKWQTCDDFLTEIEIWAVQKYENLVDLENPEKMSIWLLS